MKMVANIIKVSSFSVAKMSLGAARPPAPIKHVASKTGSIIADCKPLLPQFPPNQRSQEPDYGTKPITYLIEPDAENRSSYVICEEKGVDGKAADYIQKVHEKNRYDSYETAMLSPYIFPPPPHIVQ